MLFSGYILKSRFRDRFGGLISKLRFMVQTNILQ